MRCRRIAIPQDVEAPVTITSAKLIFDSLSQKQEGEMQIS